MASPILLKKSEHFTTDAQYSSNIQNEKSVIGFILHQKQKGSTTHLLIPQLNNVIFGYSTPLISFLQHVKITRRPLVTYESQCPKIL